jgi:hypothetical protein
MPHLALGASKPASELEGKGYVGKLPDISKSFVTTEPQNAKPVYEKTEEFHSAGQIKPVPRDNPAFVNIILKTDKTSPYLNDLNDILPVIEKIYSSIEDGEDLQKFVARVYFFNKTADYLRDKYDGKPESSYISFKKLMELNMHAKSVSLLRAEAAKYNPYLAYSGAGYIYDTNNINQQIDYLKQEIEQTIIVIKEAD